MSFSDPATNVLQQVLQVRCLVHAHKDKEERRCPPYWTFRLVAEPNARDMVITIETVEQLLGCLLSASNLQWEALHAFLTKSSYDLSPTYTMASYDTHVQEFRDKLVWLPYVVDTEIDEDSDCVRKAFLATFVDKEFPFLFNRKHQGTHEHDVPFHQLVKQVRRLVLQKCQTEVAQLHRHQLEGTVSSMVSGNNSYSNANRDLLPFVSKPAGSGSGSGGRNQPDRKRKPPGRKNQPPGQPGKRRTQNPAGPADHGTVSCNFCHRPHEAEKCFFKHPHNAPNKWRRAHGLTQLSEDERAKFVSAKGSRKERPANSRLWEACLKAAKKGNFQLSKVQQALKKAQASQSETSTADASANVVNVTTDVPAEAADVGKDELEGELAGWYSGTAPAASFNMLKASSGAGIPPNPLPTVSSQTAWATIQASVNGLPVSARVDEGILGPEGLVSRDMALRLLQAGAPTAIFPCQPLRLSGAFNAGSSSSDQCLEIALRFAVSNLPNTAVTFPLRLSITDKPLQPDEASSSSAVVYLGRRAMSKLGLALLTEADGSASLHWVERPGVPPPAGERDPVPVYQPSTAEQLNTAVTNMVASTPDTGMGDPEVTGSESFCTKVIALHNKYRLPPDSVRRPMTGVPKVRLRFKPTYNGDPIVEPVRYRTQAQSTAL
ncbi:MAG: hypothetical protein QGI09_04780, partial [Dehalococcoidia bacterium]|nr:hypothetical protein [Dehalococcoidia bacterium]